VSEGIFVSKCENYGHAKCKSCSLYVSFELETVITIVGALLEFIECNAGQFIEFRILILTVSF